MTGLLFKRDEANKADLRRRRGEYHFGLKWGDAPTRRAHKESPEPTPCESTLTVEFGLVICFRLRTLEPISRAAKRKA